MNAQMQTGERKPLESVEFSKPRVAEAIRVGAAEAAEEEVGRLEFAFTPFV